MTDLSLAFGGTVMFFSFSKCQLKANKATNNLYNEKQLGIALVDLGSLVIHKSPFSSLLKFRLNVNAVN